MEITSREEAFRAGLNRFYTGRPCRNGHLSERYVSTQGCIACLRKYSGNRTLTVACHEDDEAAILEFAAILADARPEAKKAAEEAREEQEKERKWIRMLMKEGVPYRPRDARMTPEQSAALDADMRSRGIKR